MFRNDHQVGHACAVLTAPLPGGPYWAPEAPDGGPRPTERTIDVLCGRVGLSSSELALVKVAWMLWRSDDTVFDEKPRRGAPRDLTLACPLPTLFTSVDPARRAMVGALLVSMSVGPAAIDSWIDLHRPRPAAPRLSVLPGGA